MIHATIVGMDDIARQKQRERVRKYRQSEKGRQVTSEINKRTRDNTKIEVFTAMGGECECCGEAEFVFLTIGHVLNDGGGRNRAKSGYSLWTEVRRSGYDKARYSLLCFNCNTGAHINGGVCPHKGKKVL